MKTDTAKHTPGPWRITKTYQGVLTEKFKDFPFAVDGEGFRPCLILGDGKNNAGMAEANARLIAAAPDLLSALETVPILRVDETPASFILRFKEWYRETRNPALTKAGSTK